MGARVLMTLGVGWRSVVRARVRARPERAGERDACSSRTAVEAARGPSRRVDAGTARRGVESECSEPSLNRSQKDLEVKTLANGRKSISLDGRFGHATVLRVNPDGTRERGCFDKAEPAIKFMTRGRSSDEARDESSERAPGSRLFRLCAAGSGGRHLRAPSPGRGLRRPDSGNAGRR